MLPINHSSLYEVHLFALLPVLIFWLLLTVKSSIFVRGACVGLLTISTVLVRNETLIALGLFGTIAVYYDLWQLWAKRSDQSFGNLLQAYGIPLILATSIIALFYWRSKTKFPELSNSLEGKHTLNVAQIYSFGYGQRHPEYTDSPWTHYHTLMNRDFGKDLLSMREAILSNPSAMAEHFLWNISLIPSGLQVALFNCRSGKYNPDYAPTIENPNLAGSLSTVYIILVSMGLVVFLWRRGYWCTNWLAPRIWPLVGILALSIPVIVVMIMQRPRPSYMFPLTLALMWLAAISAKIILRDARFAVVPMILVAFSMPTYFLQAPELRQRPLLATARVLQPFRNELTKPETRVAVAGFPYELASYLDLPETTELSNLDTIVAAMPRDASLHKTLRRENIRVAVIAPDQMGDDRVEAFVRSAETLGWKRQPIRSNAAKSYRLYIFAENGQTEQTARMGSQKWYEDPVELQELNADQDICPISSTEELYRTNTLPADGLFIGHGWYPFEKFDGETFRWVNNDAEIVVTAPTGAQRHLSLEVAPGPGFADKPFDLQILDEYGGTVSNTKVTGRERVALSLPVIPQQSTVFRLHVVGGGLPAVNDERILNFRVFQFGWSKP